MRLHLAGNTAPERTIQSNGRLTATPDRLPSPLGRFDQYHPVDFSLKAALSSDAPSLGALEALADRVSLLRRRELMGEDAATLLGLHELLAYGLRGVAAYAHHAEVGWRGAGICRGLPGQYELPGLSPPCQGLPLVGVCK